MIEDIECFGAELQLFCLGNLRVFQQCHVGIVYAGSRKKAPVCISNLAQWFGNEIVRIEVGLSRPWIAIHVKLAAVIGKTRLVDNVTKCSAQRAIISFDQCDGLAASKRRDT